MRLGAVSSVSFAGLGVFIFTRFVELGGEGMWSLGLLAVSTFVGISALVPPLQAAARAVAGLAAGLSIAIIALWLAAATIGGSFRLPSDQALILWLLAFYSLLGIIVARTKDATNRGGTA